MLMEGGGLAGNSMGKAIASVSGNTLHVSGFIMIRPDLRGSSTAFGEAVLNAGKGMAFKEQNHRLVRSDAPSFIPRFDGFSYVGNATIVLPARPEVVGDLTLSVILRYTYDSGHGNVVGPKSKLQFKIAVGTK